MCQVQVMLINRIKLFHPYQITQSIDILIEEKPWWTGGIQKLSIKKEKGLGNLKKLENFENCASQASSTWTLLKGA